MAAEIDAREGAATAATNDELTRAQFLTKATLGVGGVMGLLIGVPVAGMALTPAIKSKPFAATPLGKLADFVEGKFVKVVLDPGAGDHDAYVKRRVAFVRKNAAASDDRLAPKGQGEYTVISNRCAHLGCPVQQNGLDFACPCHGGAYDKDGDRTAGPPVRPLDRFEWEVRGDTLWATDEYSLTSSGKRKSLYGPGQHTSGPESLFYPLQP